MFLLTLKNLLRRPLRSCLTILGLAISVGLLASLLSYAEGYQNGLRRELDGMGMQLMLVPLGCPYDAAARVLKGRSLDVTLPDSALSVARQDPGVAVASPIYAASLPRPDLGRTDLWVGVDDTARELRPWWRLQPGSHWPTQPGDVLLGAEAASTELRKPGDPFYSPETGRAFRVCGVLERSGTSDDSQFFVPLQTAQAMFHQLNRLTAVAVRLKDPATINAVSDRLQKVKGAQVVTMTELLGTFLNLMGAARSLTVGIGLVAVMVSALTIFNTMMASAMERTGEMGVLRAIGFGRSALFGLMAGESTILAVLGGAAGLIFAAVLGVLVEQVVRPYVPLAPSANLPPLTVLAAGKGLLTALMIGALAGVYPAWRASGLSPAVALRTEGA